MEYDFSKHALQQLQERNISIELVKEVLQNPQQIIHKDSNTVFQPIVKFGIKEYLLRVILNDSVTPHVIITVYKTSKINKYHEGEI